MNLRTRALLFAVMIGLGAGASALSAETVTAPRKTAIESKLSQKYWELWRLGFAESEEGEAALIAGRNEEAAEHYKKALKIFKEVKENNPKWNKNVVNYRISLAGKRLNTALRRIEFQNGSLSAVSGTADDVIRTPEKNPGDPSAEIAALREALAKSEKQNAPLRAEVEKGRLAIRQIPGLLDEKKALESKYNLLLLQYDEVKKKVESAASGNAELEKAFKQEKFRSEALAKALDELRAEIDALQKKIDKSEAERKKLEKIAAEAKSLKEQADRNEKQIDELQTQLKESEKKSQKAVSELKNKNEDLSEQLEDKNKEITRLEKSAKEKLSLAETTKQLEEKISALRKENEKLKSDLADLHDSKAKTEASLKNAEKAAQVAGNMANTANSETDKLSAQLKTLNAQLAARTAECANLKKQCDETMARNQKLQNELAVLANRVNKLPVASASDEAQKLQNELAIKKLTEENTTLKKSLEAEKSKPAPEPVKIQVENPVNKELETKIRALQKENEDLKKSLEAEKSKPAPEPVKVQVENPVNKDLEVKVQTLTAEVASLKKAAGNVPAAGDMNKELADLKTKFNKAQTQAESAAADNAKLTAANKTLTETNAALNETLKIVTDEKNKFGDENRKLNKDLLNIQALLEKAKLDVQDDSKIRAAEKAADEWKQKCETMTKQAEEDKKTIASEQAEKMGAVNRLLAMEKERDQLKSRLQRVEARLEAWEKESSLVPKDDVAKKSGVIDALIVEQKKLQEEIEALKKRASEAESNADRYRKQIRQASFVADKAVAESRKLRTELEMYRRNDPKPRPAEKTVEISMPENIRQLAGTGDEAAGAVKGDPVKYESCMKAAKESASKKIYEDALWQYWAAVDACGDQNPEPYLEIARIHALQNNPDPGLKAYEKALRLGAKRIPDLEKTLKAQLAEKMKGAKK